jgi:hypothetical protein
MITRTILAAAAAVALLASSAQAVVVNLGTSNQGNIGDAIFQWTPSQPTGTGYIDSFLRLHSNSGTQEGYNTSARPLAMDQVAGNFTRNITYQDLLYSHATINGEQYFRFLLDVNEPNGQNRQWVTMDALQIYTSPTGSQNTTNVASLGTLRYDMGAGNSVILDASRNHGSGSGDAFIYIPVSYFAGTQLTDFVYLYARFGDQHGDAQGGFEEFALLRQITPIPELSSFFPIIGLMVAVLSTQVLRRRRAARLAATA